MTSSGAFRAILPLLALLSVKCEYWFWLFYSFIDVFQYILSYLMRNDNYIQNLNKCFRWNRRIQRKTDKTI